MMDLRRRCGLIVFYGVLAVAVAAAACVPRLATGKEMWHSSRYIYQEVAASGRAAECLGVPRNATLSCAGIVETDRMAGFIILRGDHLVNAQSNPDRAQALWDLAALLDALTRQLVELSS